MPRFPRQARLLKRAQFDFVFAGAKTSADRYFTVLARKNDEEASGVRLGLVIAKKKIARAHERNRVKRLSRESFRMLDCNKNYDVVVLAKPQAQYVDNATLFLSLRKHWQNLLV